MFITTSDWHNIKFASEIRCFNAKIRSEYHSFSPVNEGSKIANRKKNRVVLKIGRIVEGKVLNNILKVLAGRR